MILTGRFSLVIEISGRDHTYHNLLRVFNSYVWLSEGTINMIFYKKMDDQNVLCGGALNDAAGRSLLRGGGGQDSLNEC